MAVFISFAGGFKLADNPPPQRSIRSFVRREGRITRAQRSALATHWNEFGLELPCGYVNWAAVFGRRAPVVCEIGCGDGGALLAMARGTPGHDFVAIEVYRPGVGALLLALREGGVHNLRVAMVDAVEFLRDHVAPETLHQLLIFFPDPWPKKRHHKRRLIQAPFVELAASRLEPGGILHCATDWDHYAEWMMAVLSSCAALENTAGRSRYATRPAQRPLTKYERRGRNLGHVSRDLIFQRV